MRRFALTFVLAGALLAVSAPIVAAHECVVSNRSAAGNAGALHSGRWVQLTLADIFGFIHGVVEGRPLDDSEIDAAVELAVDSGLPRNGWVTRSDKTIGEGSKNPNLANGKGMDHLSLLYGDQIVGIYFEIVGGGAGG